MKKYVDREGSAGGEGAADVRSLAPVQSVIFEERPDETYATINLGHGNDSVDDDLFTAYGRLRAEKYIREKEFLDASALDPVSGVERDEDDRRSQHFAVFENKGSGYVQAIACMRLILKDDQTPLPIELFFPDGFRGAPAGQGSYEVSRLISCIRSPIQQLGSLASMVTNAVAYVGAEGYDGAAYAVIERSLEHQLKYVYNTPPTQIATPRYLDKYRSENLGVTIDWGKTTQMIGQGAINLSQVQPGVPFYWRGFDSRKRVATQ